MECIGHEGGLPFPHAREDDILPKMVSSFHHLTEVSFAKYSFILYIYMVHVKVPAGNTGQPEFIPYLPFSILCKTNIRLCKFGNLAK